MGAEDIVDADVSRDFLYCVGVGQDASLVLLEAVRSGASGSYGGVAIKLAGLRGCHL